MYVRTVHRVSNIFVFYLKVVTSHSFKDLSYQFDPGFGFTFHQKYYSFSEKSIVLKLLVSQIESLSSLQVIISLIKVFLLYFDLGNFIQSGAR